MGVAPRAYELQLPLERPALRAAVDLAGVHHDDHLLDVATGTGALLRELAGRDPRPPNVVGLDRQQRALDLAATYVPAGWRLVRADAQRLPFADATFDVVTACWLLHLLDTGARARVLSEIARVLRPEGRAITVTVHSRRDATRTALGLVPRSWGLRPLDPARSLTAAGLAPVRARFVPGRLAVAVRPRTSPNRRRRLRDRALIGCLPDIHIESTVHRASNCGEGFLDASGQDLGTNGSPLRSERRRSSCSHSSHDRHRGGRAPRAPVGPRASLGAMTAP